jgi:hypothetical protein
MLPRIAKLDHQFADAIEHYVQTRSRGNSVLREIRAHVIHEGKDTAIRRSPTELEPTKLIKASVETRMTSQEIEDIDLAYILSKANEISAEFERQLSTHLFQTLEQVTDQTGLKMDARGGRLTNDMLIELFSTMQINFERSQSGDLTLVTAPGMAVTFQRLEHEINENSEIRARWNAMMEQKRNEFREREINRNLVG